jgi:hypothetical protein
LNRLTIDGDDYLKNNNNNNKKKKKKKKKKTPELLFGPGPAHPRPLLSAQSFPLPQTRHSITAIDTHHNDTNPLHPVTTTVEIIDP